MYENNKLHSMKLYDLALDPVKNFGKVTVAAGYDRLTTSVALNSGDGAKLPDTSLGAFNLVWWDSTLYPDPSDDPNVEIVRCITKAIDSLIISRGEETTAASNKNTPGHTYRMILSPTSKMFSDIPADAQSRVNTHSALSTGIHGVGTDTVDGITARNTAITTHAGLTSSVHNFDSSGNAPPQTHGASKHDSTTIDGGTVVLPLGQLPNHGSSKHTGTVGTWAQIDKGTSNIADITTKSHTSLTDIGTNSHTTIDGHISSYTGVHGISAGLDASKPASPTVGQKYIAVDTNKDYECYVAGTWRDITATHAALTANVHGFDSSGNAPPQTHSLASHTGIIGDHQSNLTGVGTNSHTAIDSHISSTSSVHNFDSSGNAPPQTHGASKHDSTTIDGGTVVLPLGQLPNHGSSKHTGTVGTWAQIDKGTSNIADITTKSHTSLTDIGTNSHTTIDSHISSTSSVHNFDSSGNAPPQIHGSSKHTGTIGTWTQIDKSAANISDIPSRSHGSLSDGTIAGTTNNHAAIDSHISSTSAHGASGNILGRTNADSLYQPLLGYTPENVANKNVASGYAGLNSSIQHSITSFPIKSVTGTGSYSVLTSDYTIIANGSGSLTMTLPTAVGITGQIFNIKNITTNSVTLATTSSQTIDGATSRPIVQYENVSVQSDGTNYNII